MGNLENIRYNNTMDCPQLLKDGNKSS